MPIVGQCLNPGREHDVKLTTSICSLRSYSWPPQFAGLRVDSMLVFSHHQDSFVHSRAPVSFDASVSK